MQVPISSRLLACCGFIAPGARVADIGCDHGYLGIHLLLNNIASSVIAADVNQQPLDSAYRNAHKYGVQDQMSFYLSDGAVSILTREELVARRREYHVTVGIHIAEGQRVCLDVHNAVLARLLQLQLSRYALIL